MSVFDLHAAVLDDYRHFVQSYFTVADDSAREYVEGQKAVKSAFGFLEN